jgi:hypothetical protein
MIKRALIHSIRETAKFYTTQQGDVIMYFSHSLLNYHLGFARIDTHYGIIELRLATSACDVLIQR